MVVILTSSDAGFQIDDVCDIEDCGVAGRDVEGPGCGVGDVEGPGSCVVSYATMYQQTLPYITYIKELQIYHCKTTASIKLEVVVAMAVCVNFTNILA